MAGKQTILHYWENDPGHLLTHLSTGLRFVCLQHRAGLPTRENWRVLRLLDWADAKQVETEAATADMHPGEYMEYLETTAIEMAAKAEKKLPRKRLKF